MAMALLYIADEYVEPQNVEFRISFLFIRKNNYIIDVCRR